MYKIKIITIGKIKEKWLEAAIKDYQKRLINRLDLQWFLFKNEDQLLHGCEKEKFYVCLDRIGEKLTSEEFAHTLFDLLEKNKQELVIVIGGAEGLDEKIRAKARKNLSLSNLTFTHQLTRLVLIEQIYRSFEIAKNSPYHK
jgi:23S rRNA (pseudouridine1915-N3)-methyltransferase